MELEDKFIVLKRSDVDEALSPRELFLLRQLCLAISDYRKKQGKKDNQYVVINQDEPYFPEVLKLMEQQ